MLVGRPHAYDTAVGRVELANFRYAATQLGAYILDLITLVTDQARILDGEADFATRGQPTHLGTGASAPDNHQVLAQSLHPLLRVHAETASQPNQQDYRRDSPHNAKHSEEHSHLVCPEALQRLPQDFDNIHESDLSRWSLVVRLWPTTDDDCLITYNSDAWEGKTLIKSASKVTEPKPAAWALKFMPEVRRPTAAQPGRLPSAR